MPDQMSILAEKPHSFRRRLLDALLPQDCLLCAAPSGDALLCAECLAELPQLPAGCCPRCALPVPSTATFTPVQQSPVCGRCQRQPPAFDALIALHPYAFPIDRLVVQLKYGHQLAVAGWFGEQLAAACKGIAADLIVPMPLHRGRLAERGFNQALEIARPLTRTAGLPIAAQVCERSRPTPPQEGLSLTERRRNVAQAFTCSDDLAGRHVLIVDDVVTTGASVGELARTLRLHGAARVTVAAVARTLLD
jgi:ComF family protein